MQMERVKVQRAALKVENRIRLLAPLRERGAAGACRVLRPGPGGRSGDSNAGHRRGE